jgi:hypothetical protein
MFKVNKQSLQQEMLQRDFALYFDESPSSLYHRGLSTRLVSQNVNPDVRYKETKIN